MQDILIAFLCGMIIGIIIGVTRTVSTMEKEPERWLKSGIRVKLDRTNE